MGELQFVIRGFKKLLKSVLPARASNTISAYRSRNHQIRYVERMGIPKDNLAFIRAYGETVMGGPFQGLRYPASELGVRPSVPYLLGIAEKELHGVLNTAFSRSYDCVINIGSAEGYYAVGLAWKLRIPAYAFEPEPRERHYCRVLAKRNNVQHLLTVRSWFSERQMRQFANRRCLVVCDCEGYETNLFRPGTVDWTRQWDLIIELHGREAEELLVSRFSTSHCVSLIEAEDRHEADYPMLHGVVGNPSAAISENRPMPSRWLWAESRMEKEGRPGPDSKASADVLDISSSIAGALNRHHR
ncbi:MAG: hypothetical protein C5B51_16610 [Terriglobia bacterium]|nr:MAG: hypothetical protein C5B51_16610 [Terriglobia bacterium]